MPLEVVVAVDLLRREVREVLQITEGPWVREGMVQLVVVVVRTISCDVTQQSQRD